MANPRLNTSQLLDAAVDAAFTSAVATRTVQRLNRADGLFKAVATALADGVEAADPPKFERLVSDLRRGLNETTYYSPLTEPTLLVAETEIGRGGLAMWPAQVPAIRRLAPAYGTEKEAALVELRFCCFREGYFSRVAMTLHCTMTASPY